MTAAKSLVIFDMDGTLVNTESLYRECIIGFMAELGATITSEEFDEYVGMEGLMMWKKIVSRHSLKEEIPWIRQEYRKRIVDSFTTKPVNVFPGIEELILEMEERNISKCIGSSATHFSINLVMDRSGLRRHFSHQFSGEDVPSGKPAPDIFIKAARHFNIQPSDCLVIEDSANGVKAARSAGMRCIAFKNEYSGAQNLSGAHHIIENFQERNRELILSLIS